MPAITALLHARNDALRLGRALETLLPCDEILVIDHGSQDASRRIAREYGARIVEASGSVTPSKCLEFARCEWILCLEPREAVTEALSASLFEFKSNWKPESHPPSAAAAFSVFLREETPAGWTEDPAPQTRIVPRIWSRWQGLLPAPEPSATVLEGALLRFSLP